MVCGQEGKGLDSHSTACFNRSAPKPEDFPKSTDPKPRNKPEAQAAVGQAEGALDVKAPETTSG